MNNFAPQNITVECKEQILSDGHLPKWVWTAYPQYKKDVSREVIIEGSEYPQVMLENVIPGCVDPTFCVTNPPVPSKPPEYIEPDLDTVRYTKPKRGSLSYNDGEVVTYKCKNPSKYLVTQTTTVNEIL